MKAWECLRKGYTLSRRHDRKLNYCLLWATVIMISLHFTAAAIYSYKVLVWPPHVDVQDNENKYIDAEEPKKKCFEVNSKDEKANNTSECKIKSPDNHPHDKSFMAYVKDSRDLYAQEGMWRATNFLAVIGLFQFIFGLPALAMIWFTLRATQDTLKEAREAAKATRDALEHTKESDIPYISLDALKIRIVHCTYLHMTITVRNTGNSVARIYNRFSLSDSRLVVIDDAVSSKKSTNFLGYAISAQDIGESAYTTAAPAQTFKFVLRYELGSETSQRTPLGTARTCVKKNSLQTYSFFGSFQRHV